MTSQGLTAEAVEKQYMDCAAKGKAPTVLYTIPTGQNPTGISMCFEEKKKIYQIAQKYNLIIIEDDAYFYLQFPSAQPGVEYGRADMPGLHLGQSFLSMVGYQLL